VRSPFSNGSCIYEARYENKDSVVGGRYKKKKKAGKTGLYY